MSKVNNLLHIVFGTKHRTPALAASESEKLHRFITQKLKEKDCLLFRINSMPDHLHMLIELNARVALADLMEEIKSCSSSCIRRQGTYPIFEGWCKGYFAASISYVHRDNVIEYINNQQVHHGKIPYVDEMKRLYMKAGKEWYDNELN